MANETEFEEIDLKNLLKKTLKRKKTILQVFFIVVALSFLYSLFAPKVYRIESASEVGTMIKEDKTKETIETPVQIKDKIDKNVFGKIIRDNLKIPEKKYPKIKTNNLSGTNLITFSIESYNPDKSKSVLEEINKIILSDHQAKIDQKKTFLEARIAVTQSSVDKLVEKIDTTEKEKKTMENQLAVLQQTLIYQQDLGTQFAVFNTQQRIEDKNKEIQDLYLASNNLEQTINSLKERVEGIQPTYVIENPNISENPIKPRPILNAAIGAFLGIIFGIFASLLLEWWKEP